jgi:hypothetical protein
MMKKAVMIAIALILIQTTLAQQENYNQYSELEMNIKVYTTIDVEQKGTRTSIEYLQADLEMFPRKTAEQQVLSLDVSSDPKATVKKGDTDITIEWEDINADSISYGIESNVAVQNKIRKVVNKIDFPINDLTPELMEYTKPTEFIDINQQIREKAANIVEGETDLYMVTYKLGDWVRKNVKYDLNTLTASVVQKSSWVLTNKEGVCDEITNLFISMARSLGIPARFVSGVVYSNVAYDFENHGWAEVYLPEYGWVPFDVTFGQYGWIDPSHVKMDESKDSGEPAVTYNWRSRNSELKAKTLKIETEITRTEGTVAKLAKLEIRPLEPDVGFGSYMIIEVTAENTQNYYLPISFSVTKAMQTLEDSPAVHTVLKPGESRKFYWTLKIPENLDTKFIYTTELEVQSNFAETVKSKIRYGQGFKKYAKEWAEQMYSKLAERENKILFNNLLLDCKADKQDYLSTEPVKVTCTIKNMGNQNLEKIEVCAKDKCQQASLTIAQQQELNFDLSLKKSENLTITAEKDNYIKESRIGLTVREIPEVRVISYSPEIIDYYKQQNLELKIFTETKAKDIVIKIERVGDVTLPELEGSYTINVPIKGKNFRTETIEINMKYKSEKGEEFQRKEKLGMTVLRIPWYAKILNWLGV